MKNSKIIFGLVAIVVLLVGFGAGYYTATLSQPSSMETSSMQTTSMQTSSMQVTGMQALGPVNNLSRPSVYTLVHGWYNGTEIVYLDFGWSVSIAAPILMFYQADAPNSTVMGQNNVIDTIPGFPGYSDFRRVYKVLVPSGYVPNSIKSFDEAVASGYTIEATNVIVNDPVVNPNATTVGFNATLQQGWYRDRPVYYFNFGTNTHATDPADGFELVYAPIYAFFYSNGTRVPGQHNVVYALPGNPNYSDLWGVVKVTVNPSYVPNSLTSVSAINAAIASGQVTQQFTGLYRNCPVVQPS